MRAKRTRARLLMGLVFVFSFGIAGYALVTYSMWPLGSRVHPEMQAAFEANRLIVYTHIFASAVALLLGPFQFLKRFRRQRPDLHRWLGRVYLTVGILLGGLAGLAMSTFAFGGLLSQTGFAGLALAWLFTGRQAFATIRRGDIAGHRRWMIRNFAVTLAGVTIRLYLPIGTLIGVPFEQWYPPLAWLCWVPNLSLVEWWLRRPKRQALATA